MSHRESRKESMMDIKELEERDVIAFITIIACPILIGLAVVYNRLEAIGAIAPIWVLVLKWYNDAKANKR